MTTGELIRRLQEADPTGEVPVCVGNEDVWDVQNQPAYYDGHLQQLVMDPDSDCYPVVGVRVLRHGRKVQLETHGYRDAIWENPEVPITFDVENPPERWLQDIEETRVAVRAHREERKARALVQR